MSTDFRPDATAAGLLLTPTTEEIATALAENLLADVVAGSKEKQHLRCAQELQEWLAEIRGLAQSHMIQ